MTENDPDRIVVRREDLPPEIASPPSPAEAYAAASRRVDPLARLALVLGIVSILIAGVAIGPIAMIVGSVAALRSRGDGSRNQAWAIGGIVTGTIGMLLWIGIIFWLLQGRDRTQEAEIPPHDSAPARVDTEAVARSIEPIRNALRANVKLVVERREGGAWQPTQTGSGTYIARESGRCYLLTCRHVVDTPGAASDTRYLVRWIDGRESPARVDWKGEGDADLAIVSLEAPADDAALPVAVRLGDPAEAQVGEPVFAIGNPLDYDSSLVTGVISAVRAIGPPSAPVRVFQAQIPLNPGNSGGGLYTQEGLLIGVNSWTLPKGAVEGMGFAISVENLAAAIAKAPAPVADALRHTMPQTSPKAGS